MKTRHLLALTALCATMLPFGTAQAKTYKIEYFAGNDGYNFCDKEPIPEVGVGPGQNLGAVCVVVDSRKEVKINGIQDDASPIVSMGYWFLDKNWEAVGDVALTDDPVGWANDSCNTCASACNSTPGFVRAPKGAKYFYVFLEQPGLAGLGDCELGAFHTHGTLSITVRNR